MRGQRQRDRQTKGPYNYQTEKEPSTYQMSSPLSPTVHSCHGNLIKVTHLLLDCDLSHQLSGLGSRSRTDSATLQYHRLPSPQVHSHRLPVTSFPHSPSTDRPGFEYLLSFRYVELLIEPDWREPRSDRCCCCKDHCVCVCARVCIVVRLCVRLCVCVYGLMVIERSVILPPDHCFE